jgi:hypothetical protein
VTGTKRGAPSGVPRGPAATVRTVRRNGSAPPDNAIAVPSTNGDTPTKYANRGREASHQLVDVYKILAKAGKPLTVPEIVQQMPSSYRSGASRKYKEHKEKTDPTWLEGKTSQWSDAATAEAMTWYVRQTVRSGCQSKNFRPVTKSWTSRGGTAGKVTREGTYEADRPPTVKRTIWVEKTTLVPWSLEEETALARGQVAQHQFLQKLPEYREKAKPTATETKELLDLAERAIRKFRQ